MPRFIDYITSEDGSFVRVVLLTMAAITVAACICDYIMWKRKK